MPIFYVLSILKDHETALCKPHTGHMMSIYCSNLNASEVALIQVLFDIVYVYRR
jgi:hypothetical protein